MTQARYSSVAMLFHWLIAIAVIVNWRIAESTENLEIAEQMRVMDQHKALGIVILILTVLRLLWRLAKTPPPLASTLKPWERKSARTVHILFYMLLIGLPLGGWLGQSFYGLALDVFGVFTLPMLPVGKNPEMGHTIFEAHATGGTVMLALIVLHVLGALKHTFVDKDGNLFRMLPFGTPKA
ncbi:cytochrome b [Altererythrobacter sp. CC-YST694]|uniref:cytochrome b n=1 Tax=Altererythrobacter sp. CC-YST694 TaxID=2755038 RepID=UPI001D024DD7|nr:cytochrome b [Altererythrobacter sp. CC-YST694]MCB5424803.1 cytochrome b [Altererythrobacter sp. CC-YST694]